MALENLCNEPLKGNEYLEIILNFLLLDCLAGFHRAVSENIQ